VVLKSTHAQDSTLNLAPAVVHEVTILGSRCGPFPEAIQALARKQIEVSPMISRTFRLERGLEAMAAAADPDNIKVLLKISRPGGR
jgi:threonine dehydrogenase-like Zn-dependent dehydrogenase